MPDQDDFNVMRSAQVGYYPDHLLGHAFLRTLQENNPPLFKEAYDFFVTTRRGLLGDANKPANLSSLWTLAKHEQEKEIALIHKIDKEGRFSSLKPSQIGSYIKAFNVLMGQEAIFLRNVNRIKAIHNGKGGSIDITSNFGRFLRDELDHMSQEEFTGEGLENATRRALIAMLSKNYDKDKMQESAYADMARVLEQATTEHWAVQEVFNLYFGPDLKKEFGPEAVNYNKQATLSALTQDTINKSINFQMYRGTKKGNLLEAMERLVQEAVGRFLTTATGASGMKTDNLLSMGIDITTIENAITAEVTKEASKRLQNIERMERLHKALAETKGDIIEVTDKNYSLTSASFAENKGFTAESGLKALYFESILERMKVSLQKIKELMYVLANTHELMLSGDEDFANAEKVLGAYIGYFLFDDLQFSGVPEGTNFIHVMNLDGVYIPLSTFLFAAYYAFEKTSKPTEAEKYVKVTIEQTFKGYKNDNEYLEMNDWTQFYNQRLSEIQITTHFFGDFVNFIKDNIEL